MGCRAWRTITSAGYAVSAPDGEGRLALLGPLHS